VNIATHRLMRLAEIAEKDPDQALSSAELRELLGLNRSQWQRLRTRPDFPEPIPWGGRRLGHSPVDMLAYLHRMAALGGAKTLRYIARQVHLAYATLLRASKEPGFPHSVGQYRGMPAYHVAEVVELVNRQRRYMKPPRDFVKRSRHPAAGTSMVPPSARVRRAARLHAEKKAKLKG